MEWCGLLCSTQIQPYSFTGILPSHYLLGFSFYSLGWNGNKLIFLLVMVAVGEPKSLLIAFDRDVVHNYHNFYGPHFLPLKLGMVGFLQLVKSSGWSWSCTCFYQFGLPQTWHPVFLFLGGTFFYDFPVTVVLFKCHLQALACRYHPTVRLTWLKGLLWEQTGPGLLPGQDIFLGCSLASSCSPPA